MNLIVSLVIPLYNEEPDRFGGWSPWCFNKKRIGTGYFKILKKKEIHVISSRNLSKHYCSLFVFKVKSVASIYLAFSFGSFKLIITQKSIRIKTQLQPSTSFLNGRFIMTFAIDFRLAFSMFCNCYLWHRRIKLEYVAFHLHKM